MTAFGLLQERLALWWVRLGLCMVRRGRWRGSKRKGIGLKKSLSVLCVIDGAGLLCSFVVRETKGRYLEEVSEESSEDEERQGAP